MEDLTIPGWAVVIFGGVGTLMLGWLVWLTLMTMNNKQDIAVNTITDNTVSKELKKMDDKIDEIKRDTKELFEKLEMKMERGFDRVFAKLG